MVAFTLIVIGALGIYESHFAKDEDHHHAEEEAEAMKLALAGSGEHVVMPHGELGMVVQARWHGSTICKTMHGQARPHWHQPACICMRSCGCAQSVLVPICD